MSDLNKVRSDIADLRGKKQALTQSLQNDIRNIDSQMSWIFRQLGERAYGLGAAGVDSMASLSEEFAAIDAHRADRGAKQKKMDEICARYDEEISLLESLLESSAVGREFCAKCGHAYTLGMDAYCLGCGANLQVAMPPPQPQPPAPLQMESCRACGLPFTPGVDRYCIGCGTEIRNQMSEVRV